MTALTPPGADTADPAAHIASLERKIRLQNELLELGTGQAAHERRQELMGQVETLEARLKKAESEKDRAVRRARAAKAELRRVEGAVRGALRTHSADVRTLRRAIGEVVSAESSSGDGDATAVSRTADGRRP